MLAKILIINIIKYPFVPAVVYTVLEISSCQIARDGLKSRQTSYFTGSCSPGNLKIGFIFQPFLSLSTQHFVLVCLLSEDNVLNFILYLFHEA